MVAFWRGNLVDFNQLDRLRLEIDWTLIYTIIEIQFVNFFLIFLSPFTTSVWFLLKWFFMNLDALLRVCYLDVYEFEVYDLFSRP